MNQVFSSAARALLEPGRFLAPVEPGSSAANFCVTDGLTHQKPAPRRWSATDRQGHSCWHIQRHPWTPPVYNYLVRQCRLGSVWKRGAGGQKKSPWKHRGDAGLTAGCSSNRAPLRASKDPGRD